MDYNKGMQKLPTIIASSVVRGSQQGESHGGIYLVDFQKQEANLVVDWDDSGIVPIDNQVGFLFLKVNKIDSSMTFTLLASSDNRTCYDGW